MRTQLTAGYQGGHDCAPGPSTTALKPGLVRVQLRSSARGRESFGPMGVTGLAFPGWPSFAKHWHGSHCHHVPRRYSTSNEIKGVLMSVRASLRRWGVTIAFAITLCAWFVAPTLAQDLKLGHFVDSATTTFTGRGPVDPGIDCKADCSGTACTFFTVSFTGNGKADPGGPFTFTGTTTAFFGPLGSALTPNGAVNPDGTPAGVCDPTFTSAHSVFPNGTYDTEAKGETCCVGTSCGAVGLGPPTTAHQSSVCISGTGKFAGIRCSGEETSSGLDGVHVIGRGESVSTK